MALSWPTGTATGEQAMHRATVGSACMEVVSLGYATIGGARSFPGGVCQNARYWRCALVVCDCDDCCAIDVSECIGGSMMSDDDFLFGVAVIVLFLLSVAGLVVMYLHIVPVLAP